MKVLNATITLILTSFSVGLWAQDAAEPTQADRSQSEEALVEAIDTVEGAVADPVSSEESSEASTEPAEEVTQPSIVTVVEEEEKEYILRGDLITISNNSSLGPNERSKDMVTIMGDAKSSGYVDGDMVTVLGDVELDGYVEGDLIVIMGSADLGPNAEVDGDAIVIGGRINRHPNSAINGEIVNIPFFSPAIVEHFQELPLIVQECVLLARPIAPNVRITLYIALVFLLFYLLLAALFPGPLENSRKAIEEKPLQSFFAGVLVLALHIPFILLLLITVVGIFLVPLIDVALIAMAVFGKAVAFCFMGRQIGRTIRVSALEHPLLSILIGGLIAYALYMLPFFGFFLWIVLSFLGLGAVCVAIGESISARKAANRPIAPPPLGGSGKQALAAGSTPGTQYAQETVQPGTPLSQIDNAYAALFPRVGFWWRTLATLIDFILVAIVSFVSNAPGPLIPLFIYFIVFWGWKGSTLGGMALGLRVQKISGEPLDWSTSIVRSLSSIVSFLPLCLGFFWAGWDPDNQSWHDKIAGTTVVRIPKGYTWS